MTSTILLNDIDKNHFKDSFKVVDLMKNKHVRTLKNKLDSVMLALLNRRKIAHNVPHALTQNYAGSAPHVSHCTVFLIVEFYFEVL